MQLKSIIEGALLAAGRPLTLDELADLFDLTDRPSTEAPKDSRWRVFVNETIEGEA